MKVYIVVGIDTVYKLFGVEIYTTFAEALKVVTEQAKSEMDLLVDENPLPNFDPDYGRDWIVAHDEHRMFSVIEQEIKEEIEAIQTVAPVLSDDPLDSTLPGGWDLSDAPIFVSAIMEDPENSYAPYQLSETRRWALATARITKRPNYSILLPQGTFVQFSALKELRAKTDTGRLIMNNEMNVLDTIRVNACIENMADEEPLDVFKPFAF